METDKWKGTSIDDMCNGKGPWSFTIAPISPNKYHSVLFDMPVDPHEPPKPHISRETHLWDDDHVRMPFSSQNLFCIKEDNTDTITERWTLIVETLSTPITTSYQFEVAVNNYNTPLPKFEALHNFFNEVSDGESTSFFTSLLPKIISLALKLPELLPNGVPLLKQNHNRSLSLSQQQISCLLANAFLCTFPWKKVTSATYPGVNFVKLFAASGRPKRQLCIVEKLKCICNYFRRVTDNVPLGIVTFERKMIPRSHMPRWDTLDNNLGNTKIHITSDGTIEDCGKGFLQVDFANKNVGGGVLGYGCVQEEIRFVICPELIISRLFVEQLTNSESVTITGVERYNNYSGYGDTFTWIGNHDDHTPYDGYRRKRTTICVIDATRFNRPREQFQSAQILRELNKAYVGFSCRSSTNLAPIATGNWGCGAFQGSKNLKTLIQLMACSASGRNLVYYTFGDEELMEEFYNIHSFFAQKQLTICQLWRFLNQFNIKQIAADRLYSFIQQLYFDSKKQLTISNFFGQPKPKNQSPIAGTSVQNKTLEKLDEIMEVIESPSVSTSSSSEDVISSSQPDSPPPSLRKFVFLKKPKPPKRLEDKMPTTDLSEIFDMLDGNKNNQTQVEEKPDSFSAVIDKYATQKEEAETVEIVDKSRSTPPKKK